MTYIGEHSNDFSHSEEVSFVDVRTKRLISTSRDVGTEEPVNRICALASGVG